MLRVGGAVVERHVRVPSNYAGTVQPGAVLPVHLDPAGSRAIVVEWPLTS